MIALHAGCMLAGVLSMTAGISIAMIRRKGWWLRVHRWFGSIGVMGLLLGLVAALYMVARETGQHFAVPHAWLGIVTVLTVVGTYAIGVTQLKIKSPHMRPLHRWAGRASFMLLVLNILSGLFLVGVL